MGSRSTSRRLAMQALYQSALSNTDVREALISLFNEESLTEDAKTFSENLINGITEKAAELDRKISEISKNWSLDRISPVDKSILRLAMYEIMYEKDTPRAVVINEAIELAKRYSDEDSSRFINGILGAVVV